MNQKVQLHQRVSTLFLRLVIIGIGIAVMTACIFALPSGLRGPDPEGFKLVIIAMYISAAPFFFALLQALKLLHFIDRNKAFSYASVRALRMIKYSAVAVGIVYLFALPKLYQLAQREDAPGVMAIGVIVIGASVCIAVFAAVLQKLLFSAISLKKENDLTV